ncbi:unnamed protein product, partial [Meganyctiphanes norvegica]
METLELIANTYLYKGVHARHLKALGAGLLMLCLTTLLVYSTPPTAYVQVGNSSFRTFMNLTTFKPYHDQQLLEMQMEPYMRSCVPRNHIMFLKTHKCASSTVQNIFLRYGYNHNLTFALPGGGNYLGNPGHFKYSMIPRKLLPPSGKVDIFAVHTRLSPDHDKVLYNDSIWITVVRDPVSLYESLYNFFHLNYLYKFKLEDLVKLPMKDLLLLPRYGNKFGKNQMLFDLGYEDNMTVVQLRRAIEEITNKFNLVMIAELFDESLILLRHLLCWSLHDVVFFTKNARREEVKKDLPLKTKQTIREMNSADALLYNHFLIKHTTAVAEFGKQKMADEVAELRGLRDEYFEGCGVKAVKGRDPALKFKEYSGLVSAYALSNNTDTNCFLLSLPELPLVETVRKYQTKLLKSN